MKRTLIITILLTTLISGVQAGTVNSAFKNLSTVLLASLQQKQWIHGSPDCKDNKDTAIEVFQYDSSSYVLRQNKCLSYEAPFIYVLVGDEKTLVVDTGATQSADEFPLYKTVLSLHQKHAEKEQSDDREILVIHSHSHSDHYSADSQFEGQENVIVVPANSAGVHEFFAFNQRPNQQTILELGGRKITIVPTPGHQDEAIAIYDTQTKWLLTGDTLYPGYIYVKDWDEYKKSIARLVTFTSNHSVTAILGAHIEMTKVAGEYYDIGTSYQPEEASLVLKTSDLTALNEKLKQADKAEKIILNGLIIEPLGALPKLISNIARWFIG